MIDIVHDDNQDYDCFLRYVWMWPVQFGALVTIGISGKVAILVKKWLEKRKDQMAVGPAPGSGDNLACDTYNTVAANKTMISVGQSLGYLILGLGLTMIPYITPYLAFKKWSDLELFQYRETIFLLVNDILLPTFYYYRSPELSKFVIESFKQFIKNTLS